MKISKKILVGVATAAIAGLFAQSGIAQSTIQGQQSPAQPQMESPQAPAANVTDAQLEQYVSAAQEITDIRETYISAMNDAETQEEAQAMQTEAQQQIVGAVEDAGLSVQAYNDIGQAIQSDPSLREKAESML